MCVRERDRERSKRRREGEIEEQVHCGECILTERGTGAVVPRSEHRMLPGANPVRNCSWGLKKQQQDSVFL